MASVRHVHAQWRSSGLTISEIGDTTPSLRDTASCVAIFGDDIIVPEYALQVLVGTLQEVGCEINTSKTCYQTPFRESCGSEWYNGIDVSITRNRRYYYAAARRIVDYPVLLDLQRKFFLQGLVRTAALLLRWAQDIAPVVTIDIKELAPDVSRYFWPESPFRGGLEQKRPGTLGRVPGKSRDRVPDHGGSATAFPSGLDIYVRSSLPFDKYCAAIGWDTSLDRGVRTRFRKDYQRVECRLPTVFQLCREWRTDTAPDTDERKSIHPNRRGTRDLHQDAVLRLSSGYPRLLARVVGDYIERIAIRGQVRLKMAWTNFPFTLSFNSMSG